MQLLQIVVNEAGSAAQNTGAENVTNLVELIGLITLIVGGVSAIIDMLRLNKMKWIFLDEKDKSIKVSILVVAILTYNLFVFFTIKTIGEFAPINLLNSMKYSRDINGIIFLLIVAILALVVCVILFKPIRDIHPVIAIIIGTCIQILIALFAENIEDIGVYSSSIAISGILSSIFMLACEFTKNKEIFIAGEAVKGYYYFREGDYIYLGESKNPEEDGNSINRLSLEKLEKIKVYFDGEPKNEEPKNAQTSAASDKTPKEGGENNVPRGTTEETMDHQANNQDTGER